MLQPYSIAYQAGVVTGSSKLSGYWQSVRSAGKKATARDVDNSGNLQCLTLTKKGFVRWSVWR